MPYTEDPPDYSGTPAGPNDSVAGYHGYHRGLQATAPTPSPYHGYVNPWCAAAAAQQQQHQQQQKQMMPAHRCIEAAPEPADVALLDM